MADEKKEEEKPKDTYVEKQPKKWVRNPKFTKPVHDEEK